MAIVRGVPARTGAPGPRLYRTTAVRTGSPESKISPPSGGAGRSPDCMSTKQVECVLGLTLRAGTRVKVRVRRPSLRQCRGRRFTATANHIIPPIGSASACNPSRGERCRRQTNVVCRCRMMNLECEEYVRLSDREMAAAHRAKTVDECVVHLDRARRYALLACRERQWRRNWAASRTSERVHHSR